MTEHTSVRSGATVDELLRVAGEQPIGGEMGGIRTGIRVYRTPERADLGRVNKVRERIAAAICKSAFSLGLEDFESQYQQTSSRSPLLAPAVRRIYDKTSYKTGAYESGLCDDPHERGFAQLASQKHAGK